MQLNYRELKDSAFQEIRATRSANIVNIRPHVIKHGAPAGSLKVQILDSNGFLIKESNAVAISSISTATYAHGYLKFDLNIPILKDQLYQIKLVAFNGYVFSDNNHIGFCRDFDLRKVTADYSPSVGFSSAFDIELWERKMTDRSVDFFDGFESSQAPTAGLVSATNMNTFVDDAAFVTFKGSAADEGDFYKNSTNDLIRYHNGVEFKNISFQSIGETQADILNLEGGPTDVVGFLLDNTKFESSHYAYTLYRRTGSAEKRQEGIIKLQFKPDGATYGIARAADFDNDLGVVLTITGAGQVQYSSDDLAGAAYDGYIRFKTIKTFAPGV